MFKRLFLFVLINVLILITIGVFIQICGIDTAFAEDGIRYADLLAFSTIVGFTGALISLMFSKQIAKASVGAAVIENPDSEKEAYVLRTVEILAEQAEIKVPEVAVYKGAPNAFATGPTKNNALIAVSTELLDLMPPEQLKAVLAHEMSHIVNGDMVTMTLLQGVLNTFVVFAARVLASFLNRGKNRRSSRFSYYACVRLAEVVLGLFATLLLCAFSRRREYRADAGAAGLTGNPNAMIGALRTLSAGRAEPLPPATRAFGITDMESFVSLFSTHPSIRDRINALSALQNGAGRGGVFSDLSE